MLSRRGDVSEMLLDEPDVLLGRLSIEFNNTSRPLPRDVSVERLADRAMTHNHPHSRSSQQQKREIDQTIPLLKLMERSEIS